MTKNQQNILKKLHLYVIINMEVLNLKLLYAEDEKNMSDAIVDILTYHHYKVDAVYDEQGALDYAKLESYACSY